MDTPTHDVVFTFSFETLADAQQRSMMRPPDRLLAHLLRHERVRTTLVAEPFRSRPVAVARRALGRPHPAPDLAALGLDETHLLAPSRIRRGEPRSIAGITRSYRAYGELLRERAERLGLTEPSVVTFNPLVAGFAELGWARATTFYARDDWASFPPHRPLWPAYREAYRRMRERGTRVCAVSHPILDRIAPTGPALVVANGIAPEEWLDLPATVAPPLADLPRPLLVYTGTIDDRVDVDMVATIARHVAGGTLLFLGPVADAAIGRGLGALANVRLAGNVGRSEVVAATAAADLCLVPHRRTDLTEAMSPLKLFEYLAGGAPVLSTDLQPVRLGHPHVVLVGPGDDVGRALEQALALGRIDDGERRRFVLDHAWPRRLDEVVDLVLAAPDRPTTPSGAA